MTAYLRDVEKRVTPARVAAELGLWCGNDQRLSWDGLLDAAVAAYWRKRRLPRPRR